jgi:hypothetical protein
MSANHSAYHRGQISLMMRQLGAVPQATDFHVFVMEGRRGTETQVSRDLLINQAQYVRSRLRY